jgi:hypothetical protein
MSANKLSVNPSKTDYLLIGPPSAMFDNSTHINFNSSVLLPTPHARNLGFHFDTFMTLDKQISLLSSSCFLIIRDIARIRRFVSLDTAISLANAFIFSKLDYCNSLYYGLPKQYILRLQKIQNSLARAITYTKRRKHISPVLKRLHWLPVEFRIQFKINLLTYKLLANHEPSYLSSRLTHRPYLHNIRSTSFHPLVQPYVNKISAGRRSFSFSSPYLWNHLPSHVRNASSVMSFRRMLKTHLFSLAYPKSPH